jgi:hypothetical protein
MTSHGRYTVRSGYYLQWKHQFGPRANQLALPGTSANNPVWKILWQLKLPSKIKIFIWRSLHGIVPLKSILANRHVGTSGACPVCYQGAEDIRHLLFICPAAQEIWQAMELQDLIQEAVSTDRAGSAILEHILRREDNEIHGFQSVSLKEVVMTTCWYLWWMRRRRTHSETVPPIHKCKFSILAIVANSARVNGKQINTSTPRWTRPDARCTKLNVDASFQDDTKLRDHQGNFIAAMVKFLPNIASVVMARLSQ